MAGKLKSVLENLDHFADLLALSRTVYVKDWDVTSVQRALEWGSYFQQVYYRFKSNNLIRNAIEDRLAAKNEDLRVHFNNHKDVMFTDLLKAKAIICMTLLHNGAINPLVFKYLLQLLQDCDLQNIGHLDSDHTSSQKVGHLGIGHMSSLKVGHLGLDHTSSQKVGRLGSDHMSSQKVACELFLLFPGFIHDQKALDGPVLVTQADFLRRNLQRKVKKLDDDQKLSAVSDVLCKLPQPQVYQLIASVLSNDASSTQHPDQLHAFILDWLLSHDAAWTGFCDQVNRHVLARLSARFSKFRQTYLDYLVTLGRGMEPDLTCGMWASRSPHLSFQEFVEHFKCLLGGPEDLREWTVSRLQTLRCQAGDYEVSGVSIWTDLLTELNKNNSSNVI